MRDRGTPTGATTTHLVSHVRLEILVRRYVHAHTPVLKRRRRDLERRAGHGRHHHIRHRKTPREVQLRRGGPHHMMRMERPLRRRGARRLGHSGAFGVLVYRVDVDGEHACAVVCEERRERAAYHFRSFFCPVVRINEVEGGREGGESLPVEDGYGAAVGAVAVGQQRVVYPDALERFHDAQGRAG